MKFLQFRRIFISNSRKTPNVFLNMTEKNFKFSNCFKIIHTYEDGWLLIFNKEFEKNEDAEGILKERFMREKIQKSKLMNTI